MARAKTSSRRDSGTSAHEVISTRSPGETRALGRRYAKKFKPGDIVFLSGELGSGKTTFVQGLAEGLGIKDVIRSSSFILVNEYTAKGRSLAHLDLYRLEGREVEDIGLDEYLCSEGIAVIEWADRASHMRIRPHWEVAISWEGENERRIEIRRLRKA